MIRPGRGVADRPPYIRAVYENRVPMRAPLSRDDSNPARGVLLACALSVPLWWPTYCGLAWVAAWARIVVGGR